MKQLLHSLILISIFSCSSKEPAKEPVRYEEETPQITTTNPQPKSMTSKLLAREEGTNLFTEIDFDKGSSSLNETSLEKIDELFEEAKKEGEIDKVQVVTWADKDFEKNGALSEEQVELAKKRNKKIKEYLAQDNSKLNVKLVNMAEKRSLLGRIIASDESGIKKSLRAQDIASDSRVSKSIIMFFTK